MQDTMPGYRGLTVILSVNSDRILSVAVLLAGLFAGAYAGMMILPH